MARVSPLPQRPHRGPRVMAVRIARYAGIGLACAVVALVFLGQGLFLVNAVQSGAWGTGASSAGVPSSGPLSRRVDAVLSNALGSSDRGIRRFKVESIRADTANRRLSTLSVQWAINADVSAGTVGNGAVADVYRMLRDIFTAHLPISLVRLDGTYPLRDSRGQTREMVVMRLALRRSIAAMIGRMGWDSLDTQTLWPLVDRIFVNPQFRPLPAE